jgi:hypothetical protein
VRARGECTGSEADWIPISLTSRLSGNHIDAAFQATNALHPPDNIAALPALCSWARAKRLSSVCAINCSHADRGAGRFMGHDLWGVYAGRLFSSTEFRTLAISDSALGHRARHAGSQLSPGMAASVREAKLGIQSIRSDWRTKITVRIFDIYATRHALLADVELERLASDSGRREIRSSGINTYWNSLMTSTCLLVPRMMPQSSCDSSSSLDYLSDKFERQIT